MRLSLSSRLYLSIALVFLCFATLFIAYQHQREKNYRIQTINTKLQDYNRILYEYLDYNFSSKDLKAQDYEQILNNYIKIHSYSYLRLTLIDSKGQVFYDNINKNYSSIGNHLTRKEISLALKQNQAYVIDRKSSTTKENYFYAATYFPKSHYIIRTALPYNASLYNMLKTDSQYIWFALLLTIVLILLLCRFAWHLNKNIKQLNIFANNLSSGENLDNTTILSFPKDELAEVAQKIISLYYQVQNSKKDKEIFKQQLTQNIAHELKTPIAVVSGYIDTILENDDIDKQTQSIFLQRAKHSCERLKKLLSDISTLNRLDNGIETQDFSQVDLFDIITIIITERELALKQKDMKVRTNISAAIMVRGNYSLLYSVFANLMDNSIAYAGSGTEISIDCYPKSDRFFFVFSDNGVGIPKESLPHIFERFYRVDKGRSRKMGGTGLGLSIVKNAILIHKGQIICCNNPQGGIRFEFDIKK